MQYFTDPELLRDILESFGFWSPAVFLLLQILQVVLAPLPGNIVALAGGWALGFWPSFLLSTLGILLGSMICFLLGRKLGKAVLRKLLKPEKFDKYHAFFMREDRHARSHMLFFLIMLFPFLPDDLCCWLAGVTDMRFRTFALIVLFARPWGLCVSALLGAYGFTLPKEAMAAIAVVMLVLSVLALRYARPLEEQALSLARRFAVRKTK